MALISARSIITSISIFHVTLAFFFLTNPTIIADQTAVWVLGSSMGMPRARGFDTRSPQLAFLSLVLAFLGVSDLVSLSMPEEISLLYHWGTQAPLRLTMSLAVVFYTFFTGSRSPLSGSGPRTAQSAPYNATAGWGGNGLRNDIIFTFAFIETMTWFWAWVTIRDERVEVVRKSLKDKREE